MRIAIIACVDASPVLDFGEQVLDQTPLFVGRLVVAILHFAVSLGGMRGVIPRAVSAARNQSLS